MKYLGKHLSHDKCSVKIKKRKQIAEIFKLQHSEEQHMSVFYMILQIVTSSLARSSPSGQTVM